MSNGNSKKAAARRAGPESKIAEDKPVPPTKPPAPPAPPVKVPPLFRPIDWATFGLTFVVMFLSYWWTLAPDLTLEDCGELAVGSFYAGVPHPPGYPVWTIYTWLWTLLPIANIAYRVALSSAFAGALGCGLLALMVSRGSSMMIEGVAELKSIERRWESALCMVAGMAAGMLLGFNGFMWSQAVIVEVYTLSVLSLTGVLCCLLRWIHAPHQRRYLYLAFFWFGICFNNHQSLLVVAMGIEVAVIVAQPKLGRELVFWNVIIYLGGLAGLMLGMIPLLDNGPLKVIYNSIGIASFITWVWLLFKTKKRAIELARDFALVGCILYLGVLFGHITTCFTFFYHNGDLSSLKTGVFLFFNLAGLACIAAFISLIGAAKKLGREWTTSLICGGAWITGAAFYLYMPLASMSNPPLNWGYPRTVTGFFHAFTRGQYERIHPTPDIVTYFKQFYYTIIEGTLTEFNLVYLAVAVLVFFFYRRMQLRERAWIAGLGALYVCLGPLLLWLLSPAPDRQSQDLNKPFFIASHVMIALFIGYGLTLLGATLATQYKRSGWGGIVLHQLAAVASASASVVALVWVLFVWITKADLLVQCTACFVLVLASVGTFGLLLAQRRVGWGGISIRWWAVGGCACASMFALYWVVLVSITTANPLVHYTAYFGLALGLAATGALLLARDRAPMTGLLAAFALMPIYSIMSHWEDNEQRGHLFGYWFGHDMFTPPFKGTDGKPIYPEMDRDAVLFGGTDPGRFNPTYMIFCESFIPPDKKPRDPQFDRRDVYLITQNALADGTYLSYIRAHYNRSTQIDPPFFSELLRGPKEQEQNYYTNFIARMMLPLDRYFTQLGDNIEERRRAGTSFFEEKDFTEPAGLAAELRQGQVPPSIQEKDFVNLAGLAGQLRQGRAPLSKFIYSQLSGETQRLLAQGGASDSLRRALAGDLNRLLERELAAKKALAEKLQEKAVLDQQPPEKNQAARAKLDQEIAALQAIGPLYDPERFKGIKLKETSNEQSQRCFSEYLTDAQRRLEHDRVHPNEQRQIQPMEDVKVVENHVQVSGQVAVMAINALLTKVIFDQNPDHEFYVEESFPLDWMYPHLSPFGIIMKIHRDPLPELTEEMVKKDHEFWSQYSQRLIGNWITYDTSVSNVCAFAEKIYNRRNYRGFTGDPKFIRDNDGQKAFSKLRSSIAGVYKWRLEHPKTAEEQRRALKEAEFAFKQAYAFCPYSPEAVFRYINLLLTLGRVEDARLIAVTSQKLDPNNGQMQNLVSELERFKQQSTGLPPQLPPPGEAVNFAARSPDASQLQAMVTEWEKQLAAQPGNPALIFQLVQAYQQLQQPAKALPLLEALLANPQADLNTLLFAANGFNQLGQPARVEESLARLVKLAPDNPEAWFDLAGIQAALGKKTEGIASLSESLKQSAQRLAKNPKAANLYGNALTDPRFNGIRQSPEFQKLLAEQKPVSK